MIYVMHQPRSAGTSLQHWLKAQGVTVKSDNIGYENIPVFRPHEEVVYFSHAMPTPTNIQRVGSRGVLLLRDIRYSYRSIVERHKNHYFVRKGFEGRYLMATLGWFHYGWLSTGLPVVTFEDLVAGDLGQVAQLFGVDADYPFPWESRMESKGYTR